MISVIIPTLNAGDLVEPMCWALSGQTVPNEVIVVDSSSDDDTVEVSQNCGAKTITIKRGDFNHGATRNLAVSHSSGDILVFLTQDAQPYNKYCLEYLTKPFEDPQVGGTCGRQVPRPDALPPERFARSFNYPAERLVKDKSSIARLGIKTFFFSNVLSAVRRSTFESLGRFPENVIMDEDLYFGARLILKGHTIIYVPEAKVFHSHNFTWTDQFQRYFDIGVFFRDNSWLFAYTGVGGEGSKFVLQELKYLWQEKARKWIPFVFGEAVAKFTGFSLGLRYTALPRGLVKKMSLHKQHWDRAVAEGRVKGSRFKVQE